MGLTYYRTSLANYSGTLTYTTKQQKDRNRLHTSKYTSSGPSIPQIRTKLNCSARNGKKRFKTNSNF